MNTTTTTKKAFFTLSAQTAAAIRARALYAPDMSPASRAAFAIDGVAMPPRSSVSARRSYVRASYSVNAQFTSDAIAARTENAAANVSALDTAAAALSDELRRAYAKARNDAHVDAFAVGHVPAVVRSVVPVPQTLFNMSVKAARAALKVAARGGESKAREMRAGFERDVRAMVESGLFSRVMSDGADFVHVAARAFIECGAWSADGGDIVDVAHVVGVDSKGRDVTAFIYAMRACHAHMYRNRAVRGRSARAVYLDTQEGNTDAIVCAAGMLENPIAQWEGQEHVSAILRDVAAAVGDKRARIALRLYQGYTQEEIARELHMTQSAVAQNLAVIRRALADMRRSV